MSLIWNVQKMECAAKGMGSKRIVQKMELNCKD